MKGKWEKHPYYDDAWINKDAGLEIFLSKDDFFNSWDARINSLKPIFSYIGGSFGPCDLGLIRYHMKFKKYRKNVHGSWDKKQDAIDAIKRWMKNNPT